MRLDGRQSTTICFLSRGSSLPPAHFVQPPLADSINQPATRLDIEEERVRRENRAVIVPERYESSPLGAVFRVVSSNPLEEAEFEFRTYSGDGGLSRRNHVTSGELRIPLKEFDQPSDLETPGPREFVASATWKRMESDEWEGSGLYRAMKGAPIFQRADQ